MGSAVPSRVSLLISILRLNLVLTCGIPPEFRGGVCLFILNRHTSSGQSRVYRVTQLRTDGVHCRESAGTGPVSLKVVPNECCLGRSPWDQLICASLSHTHYWYEVGIACMKHSTVVWLETSSFLREYSKIPHLLVGQRSCRSRIPL